MKAFIIDIVVDGAADLALKHCRPSFLLSILLTTTFFLFVLQSSNTTAPHTTVWLCGMWSVQVGSNTEKARSGRKKEGLLRKEGEIRQKEVI
mmetsp:Transcript_37583/g.96987  ORF Transcript_37583/g.96987 Transcript_37583/m.96987 type:complete len:92 (-) Transcript_37583:190-465(-)